MPRPTIPRKDRHVFINCPFDAAYWPLMKAIVFTVQACSFQPRCARERDDCGEVRLEKILQIIGVCTYGIHDLSRKGSDPAHGLARFNMPFELGLFLAASRFGRRKKATLVLETEQYDYHKFISDIAGQDIRAHGDDEVKIIGHVRDWLNAQHSGHPLPGAHAMAQYYRRFQGDSPRLLAAAKLEESDATFIDWSKLISEWLRWNAPSAP